MEGDKEQFHSSNLKKELGNKVKLIESLKDQIKRYEKERVKFMSDQDNLIKLYDKGIIDYKGHPLPFNPNDNDDMK